MSILNMFKTTQAEPIVTEAESIFKTKEDYLAMIQAWKDFVNGGGEPNCAHHLLYALLRKKDMYHGFTETTSAIKLANGAEPFFGLRMARDGLFMACNYPHNTSVMLEAFGSTVTKEMIQKEFDAIAKVKFKGSWH